ncbi:HNH endonuclease-domain-containing protein, partial [Tuber indicum]
MSQNRSLPRNVTFYDATKPDVALGGLVQNGSITEANFLDMLEILLVVNWDPLRVQGRKSSHIVSRTDMPLRVGVYDIYCDVANFRSFFRINDEPWIHRLVSRYTCHGEDTIHREICDRDWKCVISGVVNPEILIQADNWAGFEVAHIFPLERGSHWTRCNYGRWITDMDDATGSLKINSSQNGILLLATAHLMFKQYLISVNPDDGYKVVVFDIDRFGFDGRILDPVCRSRADPHHISDELLRWHFRQAVLANLRGEGEPIFEHDLLPGTDMVGEIFASPYAQERFELEIGARLREAA